MKKNQESETNKGNKKDLVKQISKICLEKLYQNVIIIF